MNDSIDEQSVLSSFQLSVLCLIADGKQSKEVARIIKTTAQSVDATLFRLMNKLGAPTRAGLIACVLRRGIIK